MIAMLPFWERPVNPSHLAPDSGIREETLPPMLLAILLIPTFSIQSTTFLSTPSVIAMCVTALLVVAPCQ